MHKRHDGQRQRTRQLEVFSDLDDTQLDLLDAMLSEAFVDAGKQLTTQGGIGRDFAIIVEGLATVLRDGVEVERLGPGTFFGEHALLRRRPRTADVIALTPMRLLVAGPAEFSRMLTEIPQLADRIVETDVRRQRADVRAAVAVEK